MPITTRGLVELSFEKTSSSNSAFFAIQFFSTHFAPPLPSPSYYTKFSSNSSSKVSIWNETNLKYLKKDAGHRGGQARSWRAVGPG